MNHNLTEVSMNGQTYSIYKMDAMSSFHVARRIAPVITALGFSALQKFAAVPAGQRIEVAEFLPLVPILSQVIAGMTNEDCDYVISTCLSQVRRKDTSGSSATWCPVLTTSNPISFAYEDIDITVMLRLVFEAVRVGLSSFFSTPPNGGSSQEQ